DFRKDLHFPYLETIGISQSTKIFNRHTCTTAPSDNDPSSDATSDRHLSIDLH
ncbi:18683_t:CDS:1, partial [Gigaspora rosea]